MKTKNKKMEEAYLSSAVIGGALGIVGTLTAYLVILTLSFGTVVLACFLIMLSLGILLGLLSTFFSINIERLFKFAKL